MTPPAPKTSGTPWLARLLSLVLLLMLVGFALPQQTMAQDSLDIELPAALGGTTHTVTIFDADPVGEGRDALDARFRVTVEPPFPFGLNFDVRYTFGTADLDDLGSDRPTTIQLSGAETTISVPIEDDETAEGIETFIVGIRLSGDISIQATGTINANDTRVTITAPPTTCQTNDLVYSAVLNGAHDEEIALRFRASPTNRIVGDANNITLAFPAGTVSAELRLKTTANTVGRDNTLDLFVTGQTRGGVSDPDNITVTAIGPNDRLSTPLPGRANCSEVSIANTSVAENDGNAEFTVSLTNAAANDVVLAVAYAAGTATLADDLGALQTTVTINQGQTSATLLVPIINDEEEEDNETFTVTITGSNLPPEAILGSSTTATGTIEDDDDGAPDATVSIANASVAENDGNAEFTVSLTQAVESDVTVAVAYAAGTANLTDDLGTRPDTVTIDRGQTSATLLVPITNDNIVEGNEDFTVTISEGSTPLPEGVTIGTDNEATGTITDNDMAEVTLGPATLEATENGTFTYTVSLSKAADEAVTVRWTATDGTAIVNDDLQEQTNTVTFPANDNTAREFTISPVDDPVDEVNETFTVTLEVDGDNPLPTGVTIGTNNTSTATITDNDDPTGPDLTVDGVSVSSASVVEGASFTINATVNNEGNAASAATTLTYYRSADATITTDDTSIATDAVGALAASGSSTQDASVSIATAGTYYVGACVPTVSGETDTDNNCSTGVQVVVTAAVAPQITTQPTDQSVTVGENATFTVAATGTPTPTYQWRFEGSDISGATSATYTLSNAALTNAGDYTVVVTNTAGAVTSSAATLTVTAVAPDLTVDSVSVSSASVVEGASFTINATVNNEGNAASAATTLTYYRSADATITTDDTSIATDAVGALAASGSSTQDASVSIATAGTYYVGACVPTVSGETDTDNNCSTGVQIIVTAAAVAPQITTQPTDQSVTVGGSATFTVAATGTPTPTYQWRFEGSDISGATSASYTLSNAALTNAGDYTVVVTNTAGTVTSSAATLTVTAAAPSGPDLTVDGVTVSSASVVEGASFTINATVNNEGNAASAATTLTYYRSTDATITTGDTSIATDAVGALAASGSSTQDASVSIATAGTYYVGACVPTVSGETDTDNNCSTGVQVVVTAATVAPQITTQPTDQSVTVGGSATFTVAATGTPTPTYQWRFEGSDIAGATSATYTLSNAALTNAGDYTVVVTNTAGEVTSTAATLTVTPAAAPDLTVDGVSVSSASVVEGASFTINATVNNEGDGASAATTLTYYRSADATITTDDTSIGTDPVGALAASGSSPESISVSIATAGTYYVGACVPTVSGETDTDNNCSTGVQVVVTAATVAPQITTQPTDQSVTVGGSATFTVAATGTPTPTYQWRFEGSDIAGATSASYTISSAALTNAGDYTVVVTNTVGEVTSTAATLTVTAPDLTVDSVSVSSASVVEGASFTINATVNNGGNGASAATTLTYYRSADATITTGDTSIGTDPVGALAASGSSPESISVSIATAGTYYVGACVPTVSGETDTDNNCSTGVQVVVTAATVAPQITTQPTDQSVTVGGSATFTVAATGTPTPTYQWRFEGTDISGATSASYTISNAAVADAGSYTVVVTNSVSSVTSSVATLTVTAAAVAPQITTQPTDQSVTVGENATFTVAATGTSLNYQWRKDGSDISGATSASYTISGAAVADAGDYTVVVTNSVSSVTSSVATLTVTAPDLTVDSVSVSSASVVEGASFTINATVNNEGDGASAATTLTYYRSADATITTDDTSIGTDPIGALAASGSSTQDASVSIATADTYYVGACVPTVSGETNTDNNCSTGVQVTVTAAAVAPQITTQPTDQSVTVGENATFTVAATGTPTPTYQWRFEGSDISGATSASYTLSNAALTNAGDYTVVVTNTAGTVTSSAATLTVTAAAPSGPDLTVDGVSVSSASVVEGASFTINATVNNGGNAASAATTLTYYRSTDATITTDDTSIATDAVGALAASGSSTQDASVSIATAGTYYVGACVPTVSGETDTDNNCSTGVQVVVTAATVAPQITTQPTDQSVTVGGSATFTVAATGTPTPTYQWRFEGSDIAGATSATYTLSNAALTNAGDYTVVVTNTAGEVTSTAATLTVTPAAAPDLTVDGVSVSSASVVEGASFTINATVNNEGDGASAATTLTYYRSADATITTDDTSIGTDPVGALAASGSSPESISVSIATAGTYYVGACVPTVSGETDTDNNCSTGVQVVVTAATVAPQITTQPTDQSVTVGGSATFTVAATGTPTPTYQWRFEGSDIAGATSASYTISSAALTNAGDYTVVVTNTAGEVTSTAATLTVTAPDLTVDSVSVSSASVVEGASFTINATVNNGGNGASAATTLTYYRSADATITTGDTSIGTDPVGALAASGSSPESISVSIATAGTYYVGACVPTVSGETDTDNNCSTGVQVVVTAATVAPQITTQPTDQSVTVGGSATFTVAATGTPTPTYQWRFEGTDISGATSASYTISNAAVADAGSYTVVVTNSVSSVTSSVATLTVTAAAVAPQITTQPTDQSVTVGENATFTVAATGTSLNYQWRKDGSDISGATSASYTISGAAVADAGDYTVVVTNSVSSVTSSVATLTVTAPDLTVDSVSVSSASVVEGASFTINATVNNEGDGASAATTLTYYRSADATITTDDTSIGTDPIGALAASGSSTQDASVSIATADTYYVGACVPTVSGETNTDNNCSTGVQVTVTAAAVAPQITTQPTDQSVTVGENATFTVAATGTPTPTYQWRFEGSDISGATSASYTLSNAALTNAGDYTVVVTNTAGTVTSSAATLTVTAAAPSGPDLTVDGVSVSSASVVEGASFTINATVNNGGNAASAATTLTYYRSTDATITTDDTSIATDAVGALAASGSSTQDASVSIATAGTYYVGACVPTVSGETDTDNNCSTGVEVTVTAAAPPPTVTIGIANASATEGGDIRFPVTLSTALLEPRTLNIGYTAGSGNTGAGLDDLGGDRPTTLTLPTGTTTVNLVVPTVDDTDDENNETFTVTLSLPDPPANPANTLNITTNTATGTINDNDETPDAEVSIANASVAENAAAGTIGFTVSLDRAVDSDVTLAVAYAAVTATLATDLGTRPTTVTIDRGQTEATLMVPVTNDAIVEGNETFTVTLSEGTTALPDGVTIGADNAATGTITDNDTANVSLSSTDPPAASEGGTITFTVELDNSVAETFTLGWAATNGTATVNDDLDDQSGTVEIAANARTATFTIPITNDDDTESSETFTVALTGAPTGLVRIAPSRVTVDRSSATGTINASDTGDGNTVNIGNRSVAENVSGGSIGFTVSLDRAVGSAVTLAVAYTAGTATLDDDLRTPRPATVTINANTTSATLLVPIANETLVEGSETFTVTLSADPATPLPAGVIIGNGTATGTITNDDEAEIRTNVSEVNETGGSLTFRPGVTAPLAQDLVLAWEVTGGTASAADFSQYVSSGTVTIPARQNSATILFFPRDDDLVEGNETLTLTFSPAPGTTLPDGVTFGRTTATATIRDSDEAVINLRLVADVSETDRHLTFRPELNRRLTQDVTLSWEVTGGTASADDFNEYAGSGTVTIDAGRGGAPIRFFPLDDDAVEGDETLEVTISVVPGTSLPRGVTLGTTTTATGTIADSDAPVVTATVDIDDESVAENVSGGTVTFTATLSQAVNSPVVLAVAVTAGTATLGVDLGTDLPTTVTIDANTTEATFTVPITDDTIVEGNETFTVTLSESDTTDLPDGVTIPDGTATGTITDNDAAEITLTANTAAANENGGTFSYTVNLSAAADEAVTVRWTATDGTATVANDLQATTNTVTFAANDNTAQTFTIRPVNDNEDEDNETFTVTLEVDGDNPLPTGVTIGTDNTATGIIEDDDDTPVVNATVDIDDESVAENVSGGNATFTATLSQAVSSPVVLAVEVTAGTATLGVDLGTDLPTTVTIDQGQTSATFTVPITDDTIVEGNETFTVTLSESDITDLPDGVTIRDGIATGTITDNDEAPPPVNATVSIADADPVAEGAGPARFTISLGPQALTSAAVLNVAYAPGTATNGTQPAIPEEDLRADRPATVTIPAGRSSVVLEVPIADDEAVESRETFTVTLSAATEQPDDPETGRPPAFVLLFPRATATGTIADNDDAAPPVTVTVNIADADPVTEGAGPARFTVSLSRAVGRDVVLDIAYAAGTASLADLGNPRPATVTIKTGATKAAFDVPIFDDDMVEGTETFTVTLTVNTAPDGVTVADGVATGTIAATAEPSVLIEPRRIGAGTALRRHAGRFDKMTGTVVRGRLRGSGMKALSFAEDMKNGRMAAGGQLGKTRWGSWIDGSYAGFGGKATGRQADVYGGFDFLGGNGKWLIGALAGHEMADLEIGKATYSASYTHLGLYGGVRLSDQLVFDGALTYGMATPEVTLGDVSASYDANRITARIALTGDFGLAYGLGTGSVKVEPQVGLLYSREALGAFTDSAGRRAGGEVLELGRFSFGPRLTWDFDWGQVVGGARVQWDFLQLEDGVDGRLSGAADIGLRFDIAPGVTLDLQGDVDGIGIAEGFRNFGGTIGLQFDLAPDVTLGLQGNVDGIGITDDSRNLGSKGFGVGGRVQLGVRF